MTERTFNILGLCFIALMILVHVIALKDEQTVQDGIASVNGLMALQEAGVRR